MLWICLEANNLISQRANVSHNTISSKRLNKIIKSKTIILKFNLNSNLKTIQKIQLNNKFKLNKLSMKFVKSNLQL